MFKFIKCQPSTGRDAEKKYLKVGGCGSQMTGKKLTFLPLFIYLIYCWYHCFGFIFQLYLRGNLNILRHKMLQRKFLPLKCMTSNHDVSKTWILILHNGLININDGKTGDPEIVKLRHPRSGASALFVFSCGDSIIQEVFSLMEKRSWFINDSVRENGNIYFSTPVDPLLLILPYLKKSKEEKKVVPLEDLLIDDVFPETQRILKLSIANNMHLLADRKGSEDLNAWMYSEEKTIKWLCKKAEKVAKVLQEKQINVTTERAISKNFVKSVNKGFSDSDGYLKCAHGLISEYLSDDLSKKLLSSLGLPEEIFGNMYTIKRKFSSTEEQENVKRKKMEEWEIPKSGKSKCLSSKEKSMLKAANSSKSITSFFKKN